MGFFKGLWGGVTTVASKLFVGEKGWIEQVSDTADKWHPSKTTIHRMTLEDQTAGDASQESARGFVQVTHDSWFDILVDAWARLPRPVIATWCIGVLIGWWPPPEYLTTMYATNPIMLNIIWTVITFYFGARVIVKDIPAAVALATNAIRAYKESKKKDEENTNG